jgi:hypothetical protein
MTSPVVIGVTLTPPHCDSAILHAPGECKYCDQHPNWQELRQLWGIAFTGHQPVVNEYGWQEIACPSDINRPGGAAARWPGNQPQR